MDIKVVRKGTNKPPSQRLDLTKPKKPTVKPEIEKNIQTSKPTPSQTQAKNVSRQKSSSYTPWLVSALVLVIAVVGVLIFLQPKEISETNQPAGVIETLDRRTDSVVTEKVEEPIKEVVEPVSSQEDIFNLRLNDYQNNLRDFNVLLSEFETMDKILLEINP